MGTPWYTWPLSEEQVFGKDPEIEKTSTMTREQQDLMKKLYEFTQGRIGEGLPGWEGPFTAPVSGEEQFGLGQYKEAVTGMQPREIQDWYTEFIAPGERRYMEREIIPSIKESMVPGGTLRSTGTERAIQEAWSQYGAGQLGRIGETIMGERARVTGALPGYMQAAALPRMIEQQELSSQIAEFIRTTPELSPVLDLVMQILNVGTQAAYLRPREPGLLEQTLPAIGEGVGAYLGAQ